MSNKMLGTLISLIFRGISIYRWNNFPRIENVSETENLALVLHTLVIMSYLLEEKEGIKIDINFVFKKIMFSSFITLVLSDINSDLKKNIIKKNNLLYAKLELKVYNTIYGLDLPEKIKQDISSFMQKDNTIFGDEFGLENNLITFAKLWVSQQEAKYNAKIYPENYDKPMQDISTRLLQPKYEMFAKYMTDDIQNYLLNIRRLQSCQRRNRTSRKYPISVMSHLYIVFVFCYLIGVLENMDENDITDLMKKGLYHDISEAITGDVLTFTKNAVDGFRDVLGEIEEEMVTENLLKYIKDHGFTDEIRNLILNPMDSNRGDLVKIADIFSALFEAKIEMPSEEFQKIYIRTKKILNKKKNKSVDYIMKFGVDYFEEDSIDKIFSI